MNPPYAPYKLASLVHLHENNYVYYVIALFKSKLNFSMVLQICNSNTQT